jgi:hypothetical protein
LTKSKLFALVPLASASVSRFTASSQAGLDLR